MEATGWTQDQIDVFLIGKCGKRHKCINCTSLRLAGTIRLKASHWIRLNCMYPILTLFSSASTAFVFNMDVFLLELPIRFVRNLTKTPALSSDSSSNTQTTTGRHERREW